MSIWNNAQVPVNVWDTNGFLNLGNLGDTAPAAAPIASGQNLELSPAPPTYLLQVAAHSSPDRSGPEQTNSRASPPGGRKVKTVQTKAYKRNEGAAAKNRRELALLQNKVDEMQQQLQRLQIDQQTLQLRSQMVEMSIWSRNRLKQMLSRQRLSPTAAPPLGAGRHSTSIRAVLKPLAEALLDFSPISCRPPPWTPPAVVEASPAEDDASMDMSSAAVPAMEPPGFAVPAFSTRELASFWATLMTDLSAILLDAHGPQKAAGAQRTLQLLNEELRLASEWQWLHHDRSVALLSTNFLTGQVEQRPPELAGAVVEAMGITQQQKVAVAAARDIFEQVIGDIAQFQNESSIVFSQCKVQKVLRFLLSPIFSGVGGSLAGAGASAEPRRQRGAGVPFLGWRIWQQMPARRRITAGLKPASTTRSPTPSTSLAVAQLRGGPPTGVVAEDPAGRWGVDVAGTGAWELSTSSGRTLGGASNEGPRTAEKGASEADELADHQAHAACVAQRPTPAAVADVAAAIGTSMELRHHELVAFLLVLTRGILTPEQEATAYVRSFPWMPDWLAIAELAAGRSA